MSKEQNTKKTGGDDSKKSQANYKILSKEEKSKKLILDIELPTEVVSAKKSAALKNLGQHVEVKGFRKGSAPDKMIEEQIGTMKILEEMAYQAVIEVLPEITVTEKINALVQPKISITKLAENNPLTFRAEFILMPNIELADYKKIAKETKPSDKAEVTDEEINEYIDYIRSSKADAENLRKKTSGDSKERESAKEKNELPELNDEFVKTLGDFKSVDDFKKQLRENMEKDKAEKAKQKRRIEIIEKIITDSKIEIPDIMIEEELQRMLQQFQGDLQSAKMDYQEYLTSIKKTEEDLMKEWRADAIKRTKMNLILPKIAVQEKIEADSEKIASEVNHLKEHYPDISDVQANSYVSHILRNDEVFKFLENIK